jgi:hypothetical protein
MIELLLQAERSLGIGALAQAERLYWQAIDADSQNAIAIVGLAKVAHLRGDDRTAIAFARRALKVDAENAVARRLVAELEAAHPEEVRAHAPAAVPPGEPAAPTPAAAEPLAAPTLAAAGPAPEPATPAPTPAPAAEPAMPTPAHVVEGFPFEAPPPAAPGVAAPPVGRTDLEWPAADLKQVRPPRDR